MSIKILLLLALMLPILPIAGGVAYGRRGEENRPGQSPKNSNETL
jgi:hypothetical protein